MGVTDWLATKYYGELRVDTYVKLSVLEQLTTEPERELGEFEREFLGKVAKCHITDEMRKWLVSAVAEINAMVSGHASTVSEILVNPGYRNDVTRMSAITDLVLYNDEQVNERMESIKEHLVYLDQSRKRQNRKPNASPTP